MTFIDATAKRTVSIIRKVDGTQNSSTGQFSSVLTTVQSGVVCDIQPNRERDNTFFDETGTEVQGNFICYTATKISTAFRESDIIIDDADSEQFEIRGIRDWRKHWEILLQQIART